MKRQAEAVIPTDLGRFKMIAYADTAEEIMPHIALVHEDFDPDKTVLVRIHSECFTGDLFGSNKCDCGQQLSQSIQMASEQGGVIIYLRQEGRGIGLINKLKAYQLQEKGANTVDANTHLGLEVDARHYDIAVTMLQDLGIRAIHLLTNNPLKIEALEQSPIKIVSRVPIVIKAHKDSLGYLKTKQQVMGHLFNY
ncbi:MAG TPA: GTP cyclohydrolase II [Bacteroidetes bacterium]|nr:GTP cyclohydrolase II [Bacteroidota bacterium]